MQFKERECRYTTIRRNRFLTNYSKTVLKCRPMLTLSRTTTQPWTLLSTNSSWTRPTLGSTQQGRLLYQLQTTTLPVTTNSVRSWLLSQWVVTEGNLIPRSATELRLFRSRAQWATKEWTCTNAVVALTSRNSTSTITPSLKLRGCLRTEWTTTKRKPLSSCRTTWSRRSLTRSMAPIHKTNNNSFYLARWRCKWLLARPQWPSISNTDHTQ